MNVLQEKRWLVIESRVVGTLFACLVNSQQFGLRQPRNVRNRHLLLKMDRLILKRYFAK